MNILIKNIDTVRKQEKHIADKNFSRILKLAKKDAANSNEDVVTATFDLEQVLLSPFRPTGAFYYSCRLQNHNLTVTEIDTMKTYAFLWNEHEAEKGSCEVATCIYKFLEAKSREGKKIIYLFSDRCGGQNQNRMVFLMLSHALNKLNFKSIELIFLVPGHSQNENDTAHSTIESHYRNRIIYTTPQWETTIQQAFVKNDCILETLCFDDIINFKSDECFPCYAKVLADKCVE